MASDDFFTIGFEEDGVVRVGGVRGAEEAEEVMHEYPGDWIAVMEVFVAPEGIWDRHTGEFRPYGGGDENWTECESSAPLSDRAWRVVDMSRPEVNLGDGEWRRNPYFETRQLRLIPTCPIQPKDN